MRRLKTAVASDIVYGRNKANSGNAANPADLYPGAIGIFATNDNGSFLITANDNTADVGILAHDKSTIFIGTTEGARLIGDIFKDQVVKYVKADTSPAVKQKQFIGYNGTAGTLNVSGITAGDFWTVGIVETTPGHNTLPKTTFTVEAGAGDTSYTLLRQIVNENVKRLLADAEVAVDIDIITNGTAGDIAHTGGTLNLTVTYGSAVATFDQSSNISGIATGDYIRIAGATYIVSNLTGATLTLDRVYNGASATLVVDHASSTQVVKKLTSISEYGLSITAQVAGDTFRLYRDDELATATITHVDTAPAVAAFEGVGLGTQAVAAEKFSFELYGNMHRNEAYRPQPESFANANDTYSVLTLVHDKEFVAKHGMSAYDKESYITELWVPNSTAVTTLDGLLAAL